MSLNEDKAFEFFQKLVSSMNDNTYVACIGKVIKYSESNNLADIQPLELEDEHKKSMLLGCLVTKQVRQQIIPDGTNKNGEPKFKIRKLKKGDEVVVVFADGDLDDYEGGEYVAASNRKHSLNDGVVIGNL